MFFSFEFEFLPDSTDLNEKAVEVAEDTVEPLEEVPAPALKRHIIFYNIYVVGNQLFS